MDSFQSLRFYVQTLRFSHLNAQQIVQHATSLKRQRDQNRNRGFLRQNRGKSELQLPRERLDRRAIDREWNRGNLAFLAIKKASEIVLGRFKEMKDRLKLPNCWRKKLHRAIGGNGGDFARAKFLELLDAKAAMIDFDGMGGMALWSKWIESTRGENPILAWFRTWTSQNERWEWTWHSRLKSSSLG